MLTRRGLLKGTVVMMAAPAEVKILDRVTLSRFDFESGDVTGWTTVAGTWTVEEMDGAPSGRRVLVQRSTGHAFNVIVAPPGPFSDIDASVKFKPRGCVGGHRGPLRRRPVLRRPRQRPRGQPSSLSLRPPTSSARHGRREGPGSRPVAHAPHPPRR